MLEPKWPHRPLSLANIHLSTCGTDSGAPPCSGRRSPAHRDMPRRVAPDPGGAPSSRSHRSRSSPHEVCPATGVHLVGGSNWLV